MKNIFFLLIVSQSIFNQDIFINKKNSDSDWIDSIKDNYPYLSVLEPRSTFNKCIVGVVERINLTCICYDTSKIIEALMEDSEMNYDDAWEYYEFNIQDAYMGIHSPVFLTTKMGEQDEW